MSKRIESMMQNYLQMVMERTCLENQIRSFEGILAEDMIDSMSFVKPEGERVQTSNFADKTAQTAIGYRGRMDHINREWRNYLLKKLALLSEEISFFESAVNSLSGDLGELMLDMVMQEMTWDALAAKYHVSRTTIAKYRRKAIRELEILYVAYDERMMEYLLG